MFYNIILAQNYQFILANSNKRCKKVCNRDEMPVMKETYCGTKIMIRNDAFTKHMGEHNFSMNKLTGDDTANSMHIINNLCTSFCAEKPDRQARQSLWGMLHLVTMSCTRTHVKVCLRQKLICESSFLKSSRQVQTQTQHSTAHPWNSCQWTRSFRGTWSLKVK